MYHVSFGPCIDPNWPVQLRNLVRDRWNAALRERPGFGKVCAVLKGYLTQKMEYFPLFLFIFILPSSIYIVIFGVRVNGGEMYILLHLGCGRRTGSCPHQGNVGRKVKFCYFPLWCVIFEKVISTHILLKRVKGLGSISIT